MKILFVGEKRSNRAIKMNVSWKDGNLAAKTLFDALNFCGIKKENCEFYNLWDDDGTTNINIFPENDTIIGLGKKVQIRLKQMNIKYIPMIHPAARGKIRKTENYRNHVRNILIENKLI